MSEPAPSPALSLARYRPLAGVIACLAAALVVLDLTLAALFGRARDALPPGIDWGRVRSFGQRIAWIERSPGEQVEVVLGLSSVNMGLDPAVLDRSDPEGRRWLVLGGVGAELEQAEVYAEALIHARIQPRSVVLAIHPSMLCTEERAALAGEASVVESVRARRFGAAARSLAYASWFGSRRAPFGDLAKMRLYEARLALLDRLGLPLEVTFAPAPDPWTSAPMFDDSPSASHVQELWGVLTKRFQPERFAAHDAQAAALHRMIHGLRARGVPVVVVLMPEHSGYRGLISGDVERLFDRALADASDGRPPPVVDLRAAFGDGSFREYCHLHGGGRRALSEMLPGKVPSPSP